MMRAPTQGPPVWVAEWAAVIGALAPFLTLLVVLVAYLAYLQRARADNRDQWWKRAQWGIESVLSDDPARQDVGMQVLGNLELSKLATPEDTVLFNQAVRSVMDGYLGAELDLATMTKPGDNEVEGGDDDEQIQNGPAS